MNKLQKIFIVLPFLGDGGMERAMINLAEGLLAENMEVKFVLLKKGYGSLAKEIPDGVDVVELSATNFLLAFLKLHIFLRKEKPSVVLSLSTPANIISIFATHLILNKIRVIVSTQVAVKTGVGSTKFKAFFKPIVYRIYNLADVVHAVSLGVAQDLENFGVKKEKLEIIYNPIISNNIDKRANEWVSHPWFARRGERVVPVVIGVGRLVAQKDFPTLLRAFALARKERNMKLAILGEGEDRNMLEILARDLGIEEDFCLLGFNNNPYSYIKNADVFVLSSAWEGFGNVLAEAIALGVPAVSTDCPHGPAEILEGGKYGKLVRVGDVNALAEAILYTLEYPLPVSRLTEGAQRFTIKTITEKYLKIMRVVK